MQICHSWDAAIPGTLRGMSLLSSVREFLATQAELSERQSLLNRPWEEELLHWSWDGHEWRLHGHLMPPPNRRRHSTTRSGWCPGVRAQRRHAENSLPDKAL